MSSDWAKSFTILEHALEAIQPTSRSVEQIEKCTEPKDVSLAHPWPNYGSQLSDSS